MSDELHVLCNECIHFDGYVYHNKSNTPEGRICCVCGVVCESYQTDWYGLTVLPRIICPRFERK